MKKLKTLTLLLLLTFSATAFAQSTLVIELRDGSNATFLLSEMPRITFAGEEMNINSSTNAIDFLRSDVKKYHFTEEPVIDTPASIADTAVEPKSIIEHNTLAVSGVAPNTKITLCTTNGVVVKHAVATDGNCTIPLNSLSTGLYIVTYNNTTFRFLKK